MHYYRKLLQSLLNFFNKVKTSYLVFHARILSFGVFSDENNVNVLVSGRHPGHTLRVQHIREQVQFHAQLYVSRLHVRIVEFRLDITCKLQMLAALKPGWYDYGDFNQLRLEIGKSILSETKVVGWVLAFSLGTKRF